jgi:hypothetical protein
LTTWRGNWTWRLHIHPKKCRRSLADSSLVLWCFLLITAEEVRDFSVEERNTKKKKKINNNVRVTHDADEKMMNNWRDWFQLSLARKPPPVAHQENKRGAKKRLGVFLCLRHLVWAGAVYSGLYQNGELLVGQFLRWSFNHSINTRDLSLSFWFLFLYYYFLRLMLQKQKKRKPTGFWSMPSPPSSPGVIRAIFII